MIEIKDLKKSYDGKMILKGISVKITKGKCICVIGPSGSGKSTLLRCINLLEPPTAGKIFIDNEEITKEGVSLTRLREKVGMVFQQFNLFPHLTVKQNITLAPVKLKIIEPELADTMALSLLKSIGLENKADEYPDSLSGGQMQRVAIVRALALSPSIMLFDEPTSALDPEVVGDVLNVMKKLSDSGMTILVVTHEMGFARNAADEVWFMDEGEIVETGSPEKIFTQAKQQRTQEFLSKIL